MSDRPIIFSAPMVRAILEGRKTQTRRVLKDAPKTHLLDRFSDGIAYFSAREGGIHMQSKVRYAVDDLLWVREALIDDAADFGFVRYAADDSLVKLDTPEKKQWGHMRSVRRIVPSIHMPRWASRITLRVTGVKVERLQDISEEDAIAESASSRRNSKGDLDWSMDWDQIGKFSKHLGANLSQNDIALGNARWAFASYWNTVHGDDGWHDDPWVAVINFERLA